MTPLRVLAVDRNRLASNLPPFLVGIGNVVGVGILGHVYRLANGPRDERLHRAHHFDMAQVVNGPLAVGGRKRAVEYRQVLVFELRRALNGVVLVDIGNDRLDLIVGVAQPVQRQRHGLIHDLEHALAIAREQLVLHECDVGLNAGGIAIHEEANGTGRCQHRSLRIAIAVALAQRHHALGALVCGFEQIVGAVLVVDVVHRIAMHAHHIEHRLLVCGVPLERTDAFVGCDFGAAGVRLAVLNRHDGARYRPALVAVVWQSHRHQQRPDVGKAESERTELVTVASNGFGRVAGVIHQNLLRRNVDARRRPQPLYIHRAVVALVLAQVERGQVAGRVIQKEILAARVAGVDGPRVLAGVPPLDRVLILQARIAADIGTFAYFVEQLRRIYLIDHLAGGYGAQFEGFAALSRLHKRIRDAQAVVHVLKIHRTVGRTVERAVVALFDERPGFLFLGLLCLHELLYIGMPALQRLHNRRTALPRPVNQLPRHNQGRMHCTR